MEPVESGQQGIVLVELFSEANANIKHDAAADNTTINGGPGISTQVSFDFGQDIG
jgi:hypothetical protein